MPALKLIEENAHEVRVAERRVLFHVPSTALFELDEVGGAVLDLFRERGAVDEADIRRHFDGAYAPADIVEALREFIEMGVVADAGAEPHAATPLRIREFPLSTIVLNVTTGCNLGCTYCYKEDLTTPKAETRMDLETAKRGIDLLLRESGDRPRVNVVFFGGEPLSNMALIRDVVIYAEESCERAGKTVDFSLTTNATLLDEDKIAFLNAHRFGLSVSIDGPKAVHDRHRRSIGGTGTYDVVAAKTRLLLERYRARPVGARVTVTAGAIDVCSIHAHLRDEIGFAEVGFAPVTSGASALLKLNGEELSAFFDNMKALGRAYRDAAIRGENTGFSNMHQLMADLHLGNRKTLPCGAGVGLLAVDAGGGLNLCHRFTGSDLETFGDVRSGIAKDRLGQFLEKAGDHTGLACETCRIRNLCAGGCYHESYVNYDDALSPTYLYCDLMRDWIDFGIQVYAEIAAANPAFFARHVEPRSAAPAAFDLV